MKYDLIVFSHLRWHSVTQRPQHLMNRFSDKFQVLFVEEPTDPIGENKGTAKLERINDNLSVLTPYLPWDGWKVMCEQYITILKENIDSMEKSTFWFYSPFYVHLLKYLKPEKIVYDCMDELSAFKNASPNLPAYEKELIDNADVVFTGGKSLFEAKKNLHNNVYCFPSSVDKKHFEKANDPDLEIPQDLLAIKKPIVGYYGVIDERIDMAFLQVLSRVMPEVSLVMIGPFAKISEESAAKSDNIYYLGKKPYDLLPNYLKGMDITMMPFAINQATQFISPTKTLEYMAANKPIISTPIYDVVRDYSHVVSIASSVGDFGKAVTYYLNEKEEERKNRIRQQDEIIEKTSWDSTAKKMMEIIDELNLVRAKSS